MAETREAGNRRRVAIGTLFILLFVKSLLFALLVPAWLGNDEPNHFEYVLVMAGASEADAQKRILDSLERTGYWGRSRMYPPPKGEVFFDKTELKQHSEDFVGTRSSLYYRVAALPVILLNPGSVEGQLLASRMISVIFAMLTLWLIFRSALVVFGGDAATALVAVAFAGFHPQFSYVSSVVNSDALMFPLFTLVFWRMTAMIQAEDTGTESLLVLLTILALALLVKKHAVALLPIVFIGLPLATRGVRAGIASMLAFLVLLCVGILALEYFATTEMIRLVDRVGLSLGHSFSGPHEFQSMAFMQWVRGIAIVFVTYWFTYGQMVYKQSAGFYVIYAAISALAVFGAVRFSGIGEGKGKAERHLLFSVFFFTGVLSATIFTFFSPQFVHLASGRYLLYAIAPAAVFVGFGVRGVAGAFNVPHTLPIAASLFMALNAIALFCYLVPIYG